MTVCNFSSYNQYLKRELEKRIHKNPRYSLRNFARHLGLSASHLSRVLNGKKKLSLELGIKISEKLKHSKSERTHFAELIQLAVEKELAIRESLDAKIQKRVRQEPKKIVKNENFKVIAQWQHFAILGLAKMKGFRPDPIWISRKLRITSVEAREALKRLESLGLVKIKNGKLLECPNTNVSTEDDIASSAIKQNHKENMLNAVHALDEQSPQEREFNNCTICVSRTDISKYKNKIRKAFEELNEEMETDQGDELYQLNVQFFRLTSLRE